MYPKTKQRIVLAAVFNIVCGHKYCDLLLVRQPRLAVGHVHGQTASDVLVPGTWCCVLMVDEAAAEATSRRRPAQPTPPSSANAAVRNTMYKHVDCPHEYDGYDPSYIREFHT